MASTGRYDLRSRNKFFRFLDLPPELREMVYDLALPHDASYRRGKDHQNTITVGCRCPALLMVNVLIHNETKPIFYRKNRFWGSAVVALSDKAQAVQRLNALTPTTQRPMKTLTLRVFLEFIPDTALSCARVFLLARTKRYENGPSTKRQAADSKSDGHAYLTSVYDLDNELKLACIEANEGYWRYIEGLEEVVAAAMGL